MNIYRIDLALIHVRIELVYYVIIEIPKVLIFYFSWIIYIYPWFYFTSFVNQPYVYNQASMLLAFDDYPIIIILFTLFTYRR